MRAKFICLVLFLVLAGAGVYAQIVEMDDKPQIITLGAEVGNKIRINWKVLKKASVILQIVNHSGRVARTVDAGLMEPGQYGTIFDGKDLLGNNLSVGEYTIRMSVNPKVEADMDFGVDGVLGGVTNKFIFKGKRKFDLKKKGIIAETVKVKVDGEEWDRENDFSIAGNNFVFDAANATIQFNPQTSLDDDSEIEIAFAVGLPLVNPWDVEVALDGSVYIADNIFLFEKSRNFPKPKAAGTVYKVDPLGKPISNFGKDWVLQLNKTSCLDLDVDAEGNLYIVPLGHHVGVYDSRGIHKMDIAGFTHPRPGGGYWIRSIALNENNRMVIVNGNVSNLIYDATKPGLEGFIAQQTAKEGAVFPPVFWQGYGPCVAAFGEYYYQTTSNHNLIKYKFNNKTKEFSTVWQTPAAKNKITDMPQGPSGLWHAMGLELDATGLIYVADRMNHRIQIFFDAGDSYKHVGSFGAEGTDVEKCQMMAPHAVALSADSKSLYVADDGFFFKYAKNPIVKGLGRVTKLKLGAEDIKECKLTIK